jgi:hypothetical protein
MPIPAPRLRVPRTRLAGSGRSAGTEAGLLARAVRGLVATPWFAAATGFVVAAGLWIYSPHAELKFPPSAVGVVPCGSHACGITAGQDGGAVATTKGQHIARSGTAAVQADGAGRAAGSRLKFSYVVLWQTGGKFSVRISVTGRRVPRAWKLTFAMPGDQISDVLGADWRPSGAGSGTASASADPSAAQWPGESGNVGQGDSGSSASRPGRHTISFLVIGQGTPVVPTGCSFNGRSCSFS